MGDVDSQIREVSPLEKKIIDQELLEPPQLNSGKLTPATVVGTPELVEKEEVNSEKRGEDLLSALENGLGYTPAVLERVQGTVNDHEVGGRDEDAERDLPPVDRGKGALSYLLGTFLAEIMIHGLPFSFGVFENYYNTHPPFVGQKSIAIIGPVASGISYLCAPLITHLMIVYPSWRRKTMYIGLVVAVVGCLGASFATSVSTLIITQGIMFGLGIGIFYYPMLGYLNEWFVKRRGLASGIMFAGDGIAGPVLPIVFEKCLTRLGFRLTLRIWACAMALLLTLDMHFLIRARLPLPSRSPPSSTPRKRVNLSVTKTPKFISISIANLFQGLSYFIPLIYITSYASDLNISTLRSTTLLSLLNLSTVFGQLFSGHISDLFGTDLLFFISPFSAGLSVLFLWGFSKSFGPLVAFSLVYGTMAGGYSILYQRFAMECAKDDSHTQLWILGFLYFERGIGNVISGPISSALLGNQHDLGSYASGKYGVLVLFTGIIMCFGSISIVGKLWKRR